MYFDIAAQGNVFTILCSNTYFRVGAHTIHPRIHSVHMYIRRYTGEQKNCIMCVNSCVMCAVQQQLHHFAYCQCSTCTHITCRALAM